MTRIFNRYPPRNFLAAAIMGLAITPTFSLANGIAGQAHILYEQSIFKDAQSREVIYFNPAPIANSTGVFAREPGFDLTEGTGTYQAAGEATSTGDSAADDTPEDAPDAGSYVKPTERPPLYAPTVPVPVEPTLMRTTILNGTSWTLSQLNGVPINSSATLEIDSEGGISGQAPCNRYAGTVETFEGFTIDFDRMRATRRACPDLGEEMALFTAMGAATQFRLGREGDSLALLNDAGTSLAVFSRPGANPFPAQDALLGEWRVVAVLIAGNLETDAGVTSPTFEFRGDGRFFGHTGCNDASSVYTLNGDQLSFGIVAATKRACFAPAPLETPILEHLPNVAALEFTAEGADLSDPSGTVLIRLAR